MGSRGKIGSPFGVRAERRARKGNVTPISGNQKYLRMPETVSEKPFAAEFWRSNARDLQDKGRLTDAFKPLFAELCLLFDRKKRYEATIEAEGAVIAGPRGGKAKHPLTTPLAQTERAFYDLAAKFGLDPASDARVPKSHPKATGAEDRFFGRAGGGELRRFQNRNPWEALK